MSLCTNLQHSDHLTEDENAMSILLEPGQKFVKQDHFPAVHDETFESLLADLGANLGAFEQIRVVGSLLKLHRDIEQRDSWICSAQRSVILQEWTLNDD